MANAIRKAAMRAAVAVPGVPRDADGPVFREPWEAQAFAMTLALHERGAVHLAANGRRRLPRRSSARRRPAIPTPARPITRTGSTRWRARRRKRRDDAANAASLSRRLGPRLRPHAARRADRASSRRFSLNAHQAFACQITGEQGRTEQNNDKGGRGF